MLCEACMTEREAAALADEKAAARARLNEQWRLICQPDYRITDWNREGIPPHIADAARHWEPSPQYRSLILFGATRHWKTRAAFAILKRHLFSNWDCHAIQSTRFAELAEKAHFGTRAEKWEADQSLRRARRCGMLLFDDLGKESMTVQMAREFHILLETRTTNWRPTILTSELSGDALAKSIAGTHRDAELHKYVDGIISRIRQYFMPIQADLKSDQPEQTTLPL